MSKNYDNWERLVRVVLRRESDRQIALSHSRDPSTISSTSLSAFDLSFSLAAQFDLDDDDWLDVMNDIGFIQEIFFPTERPKIIRSLPKKLVFLPVEAREFTMSSKDVPERQFKYSTLRYHEVVEVNSVRSLDIRGKIKTRLLTPSTIYGAYLVFESAEIFQGFKSAEAMIRVFYDVKIGVAEMLVKKGVHNQAARREDGWMEVRIGCFYVDEGDDKGKSIEVSLMEVSCFKTGLFVQGLEFRPLKCNR